jgi:hypothetical protein
MTNKETQIEHSIRLIEEAIAPLEGVTFGYIGNLESWGDDRQYSIFVPFADRSERLGFASYEDIPSLVCIAHALRKGHDLAA